jgi:hypothetical protein
VCPRSSRARYARRKRELCRKLLVMWFRHRPREDEGAEEEEGVVLLDFLTKSLRQ